MFPENLITQATQLLAACRKEGVMLTTAESCTGGLIAALLTEIAGSSDVFERGFVTYSNQAKQGMLGVDTVLIEEHGAVSAEVAKAMAGGALTASKAGLAISVTGIAGPGGGSERKPVGLVYIGVASKDKRVSSHEYRFMGTRQEIRLAAAMEALILAAGALS